MGTKKIPMRMCTGCREMKPKKELIRVIKTAEGEIKLDATGRLNGRGAYICHNVKCLVKARKSGRIGKNLECDIPDEVYDKMEAELTAQDNV